MGAKVLHRSVLLFSISTDGGYNKGFRLCFKGYLLCFSIKVFLLKFAGIFVFLHNHPQQMTHLCLPLNMQKVSLIELLHNLHFSHHTKIMEQECVLLII